MKKAPKKKVSPKKKASIGQWMTAKAVRVRRVGKNGLELDIKR